MTYFSLITFDVMDLLDVLFDYSLLHVVKKVFGKLIIFDSIWVIIHEDEEARAQSLSELKIKIV